MAALQARFQGSPNESSIHESVIITLSEMQYIVTRVNR